MSNILFGIVYHSPTSSQENDRELFSLISYLNVKFTDNLVLVGDFNYSSIDWQRWTGSGNPMNSDEKFIDVLQKNGLHQHIMIPTRQRGDDEPHVLYLEIASGDIVSTLEYRSPLGKSDHSVISFECQVDVPKVTRSSRFNYQKDEFDELREFLNRD